MQLCQGPSIQRFQPEELEQLVCGRRDLNFAELESACHYEDGYASTSEVMSAVVLFEMNHGGSFFHDCIEPS